MIQLDNFDENDDRQKRFQRRRTHSVDKPPEDKPNVRKAKPYKRDQSSYDDYLDDEWDYDNLTKD